MNVIELSLIMIQYLQPDEREVHGVVKVTHNESGKISVISGFVSMISTREGIAALLKLIAADETGGFEVVHEEMGLTIDRAMERASELRNEDRPT